MTFSLSGALLDGCVLAVLTNGDAYGYSLTQNIQQAASVSESTLYPVLRRLQKNGYLETYDSPYAGRNRRYYKITEEGRQKLTHIQSEWEEYKDMLDRLLKGGTSDE